MLKRSNNFIQKTIRRENIPKTLSDIHSKTINLSNENETIEDLGYLQRTLVQPKEFSTKKNSIGFHGSKYKTNV